MKQISMLILFVLSAKYISAQYIQVVTHSDLLIQQSKNEAVKVSNHAFYDQTLSQINDTRQNVRNTAASIELIQQKVFNSLTNVSDGIRNVRTLPVIFKYAFSTLKNISTAISLAAGKPYLVGIVSKEAIVFYGRVDNLTAFIKDFVLNANEQQLIKPTERDRLLFNVYHQLLILDAISADLCEKLRKWTLEDAVNHVIPINRWINNDAKMINNILKGWKF